MMRDKIIFHDGPILDSKEEVLVIGVRSDGYADTPFVKEIFDRYEPVKKFLTRWVRRGTVAPGSFICIPGLVPQGTLLRPTVYCVVVTEDGTPKLADLLDGLKGVYKEAGEIGFVRLALHLPSLTRDMQRASDMLGHVVHEVTTFPSRLPIYRF